MTEIMRPVIGFVGLGLMGSAIVGRLLDLNYSMRVMGRRNRGPIEAAVARGATEASNGKALASDADTIFICVDTSESVESIMYGEQGLLAGIKPNAIIIDLGTSIPESTKAIGEKVSALGAHYMDAPLGRTPAHALDGKLNIIAAGELSIFDRVEPIMQDIGENVFYVGELGAGHTLKLINNFFGMTLATAMSEAFAISDQAGIARKTVYDVMSSGPLHSSMMDFIKANAVDGDAHQLAFSIANARKDLGYYTAMTDQLLSPSFIGNATKQSLSVAVSQGYGDKDVPEMVGFFEQFFSNTSKP